MDERTDGREGVGERVDGREGVDERTDGREVEEDSEEATWDKGLKGLENEDFLEVPLDSAVLEDTDDTD